MVNIDALKPDLSDGPHYQISDGSANTSKGASRFVLPLETLDIAALPAPHKTLAIDR